MKKYEAPEMEVVKYNTDEVLTESHPDNYSVDLSDIK